MPSPFDMINPTMNKHGTTLLPISANKKNNVSKNLQRKLLATAPMGPIKPSSFFPTMIQSTKLQLLLDPPSNTDSKATIALCIIVGPAWPGQEPQTHH
jgi:hypothetical protein